jgi:hypothetical protein
MLANQGYYRYINKHGGGASSLAFLFVGMCDGSRVALANLTPHYISTVAVLNAGRNSISFFLLLIVSMGLSVVTPSLGSVMHRVRLLTAFHFVFGGVPRLLSTNGNALLTYFCFHYSFICHRIRSCRARDGLALPRPFPHFPSGSVINVLFDVDHPVAQRYVLA